MKSMKRILYSLVLAMILAVVSPSLLPLPGVITQVEAATISKKSVTLIKGQSTTLKVKGTKKKAKWTTSDKSIASVSQKGKVVAKKAGTATITATIGTQKYTCQVTVQTPKLSTTKLTLVKGEKATLKLNGTNQAITWKSSNKKVAAVSKSGLITAKKKGTATITATVLKKKYKCKIIVKNAASSSGSSTSGTASGSSSSNSTAASGSVWIPTNGGTKYHKTSTCSGMVSPEKVTVAKAIELGFEACKKCY